LLSGRMSTSTQLPLSTISFALAGGTLSTPWQQQGGQRRELAYCTAYLLTQRQTQSAMLRTVMLCTVPLPFVTHHGRRRKR
jgi:hypothetical protein